MASVLITGGGRGIGLELTRQLSQLPDSQVSKIVVTTRGDQSSDELNSLLSSLPERVLNVVCEVTSDASVQKAVAKVDQILGDNGLDILINNVGVSLVHATVLHYRSRRIQVMPLTPGGMRAMKSESLSAVFDVNVVAAQRITSAFIPAVERSRQKKVVMMSVNKPCVLIPCSTLFTLTQIPSSTSVGSIAYSSRFAQNPTPEYKITKAAMNMLASQYALEYGPQGFTVLAASPGVSKHRLLIIRDRVTDLGLFGNAVA